MLMDPVTLGIVLTVLGMGGTLATLFLFSLIMDVLKRAFPVERPPAAPATAGPSSAAESAARPSTPTSGDPPTASPR